ncbi:hypothetical protein PHMEG_00036931 [Phytophthora megakarya]|uniref:Uncharacterized protein n=1 Tax=Phytophthora megakarya TaxID=4795 RepID=A0A225UKX2_9STRA|nr:hypothetical protein PHMEG_00036931 [Phytophthora megakarya]
MPYASVQELALEQWDERLKLDFTHGSSNLGFHVGSQPFPITVVGGNNILRILFHDGESTLFYFLLDKLACIGEMFSRRFCTPLSVAYNGILEENTDK